MEVSGTIAVSGSIYQCSQQHPGQSYPGLRLRVAQIRLRYLFSTYFMNKIIPSFYLIYLLISVSYINYHWALSIYDSWNQSFSAMVLVWWKLARNFLFHKVSWGKIPWQLFPHYRPHAGQWLVCRDHSGGYSGQAGRISSPIVIYQSSKWIKQCMNLWNKVSDHSRNVTLIYLI